MSIVNSDPLRDPKLQVERAKCHLSDLEGEIRTFFRTNSAVIVEEPDAKTGHIVVKAVLRASIGDILDPIVTDVVRSLRAALDYTVVATAKRYGVINVSGMYFIIGTTGPDVFKDKRFEKTIKKLPTAATRFMKRLKPYPGGCDLLVALHLMGNDARHRQLIPVGTMPCGVMMPIQVGTKPTEGWISFRLGGWQSLYDGVEIMTLERRLDREIDVELSYSVFFSDTQPSHVQGEPVTAVLNQLINFVERIIAIFERRFFR